MRQLDALFKSDAKVKIFFCYASVSLFYLSKQ
jgi:hypothetical protein